MDSKQAFAGKVTTYHLSPDDLALKEIENGGIHIMLKNGIEIIRYLQNLTDKQSMSLFSILNSQKTIRSGCLTV